MEGKSLNPNNQAEKKALIENQIAEISAAINELEALVDKLVGCVPEAGCGLKEPPDEDTLSSFLDRTPGRLAELQTRIYDVNSRLKTGLIYS